ncbi:MAG TPA: ABC transporter ATP-binding protein [Candidatus Polarisedimenticolia bacterium]|nr:ABC transporter ATP-binding protein [Candidatus Polarisedimenticolia bacterium]
MRATASAGPPLPPPAIEARGVSFRYDGDDVIRRLDLTLPHAEMAALAGPNGAGKTTLLKLICGTLPASEGEIFLEGEPISSMPPRERARRVALVPQETSLTFDFTVMETVLMGRTCHLGLFGLETPEDVAAAEDAMRRTGTLRFESRLLSHLSGGERHLVLIARALAQQPKVLLLDEPTAFLDIRHRLEIYALLGRLNADEGLTVLTTSHDINMAARYCRRIVLLHRGAVTADGPPAGVLQAGALSELYDTPLKVMAEPETGLPFVIPAAAPPRHS